MKEILEKVLEELRYQNKSNTLSGLCVIVAGLSDYDLITDQEAMAFDELLNWSHKNQTEFYDHEDRVVSLRSKYHWLRGAFEPREQWLVEQINLLS